MDGICRFGVEATLVANEFIDRYMAEANGEYVKVYLYLLRHGGEHPGVGQIAEALNHTEADVRRALAYWERMGALRERDAEQTSVQEPAAPEPARPSGPEQISRLQGDEDFSQLLYIAQRYLNRIFTQRDLEVFAYLYEGLHMPEELLEYLVEHCVQSGHTSIRYIEAVALSWHERGILTVEAAKAYASGFTKDSFAVMRAFGLTDRKPGDAEKEMLERWFQTYGFTRELVLEACNRTMEATHNPSFRYADKILSDWKKAGVKSLRDVAALDEKRRSGRRTEEGRAPRAARPKTNQFHNFEQRDTDYNALMMEQVKGWLGRSRQEEAE